LKFTMQLVYVHCTCIDTDWFTPQGLIHTVE